MKHRASTGPDPEWFTPQPTVSALADSRARAPQDVSGPSQTQRLIQRPVIAVLRRGRSVQFSRFEVERYEGLTTTFKFRRDDFLQHYHKRSNVESTFGMMKRRFGGGLRSKTDVAMVNETLCKIRLSNLVVLIHETHELGIDSVF